MDSSQLVTHTVSSQPRQQIGQQVTNDLNIANDSNQFHFDALPTHHRNILDKIYCRRKRHKLKPVSGAGVGGGCFCCRQKKSQEDDNLPLTSFDQDDLEVTYKVECIAENMDSNFWSMGIVNKEEVFVKMVTTPPEIWLAHVKLSEKLTDDSINFKFENQCKKLIINLKKPRLKIWKSMGIAQGDHNKLVDSRGAPVDFYGASVELREDLGSQTLLLAVKLGKQAHFGIPVAWHMRIKINGCERKYTPIKLITTKQSDDYEFLDDMVGQVIFFIIKIYKGGQLTPSIQKLQLSKPDSLEVGGICGNFDTNWLFDVDRLILIAGGTGITPFVSIIKFIKEKKRDIKVKQVVLFLSASQPDGLIWNETWTYLTKYGWLHYIPYVTKPPSNWKGNKKRINPAGVEANLSEIPLPDDSGSPLKVKGCGCGPAGFTDTCQEIFGHLGLSPENIFMFEG